MGMGIIPHAIHRCDRGRKGTPYAECTEQVAATGPEIRTIGRQTHVPKNQRCCCGCLLVSNIFEICAIRFGMHRPGDLSIRFPIQRCQFGGFKAKFV